MAIPITMENHL